MSVSIKIDPKEIRSVFLSEIKLNPKNRNKHPQEQIDRFVKVLRANGFRTLPVISKRSGVLVAGEGRYLAMKQEGMTEMLCSFQDFESEEEEYAHGIADNALQTWSSLDLSGINTDIQDLGPFDIDILGLRDFKVDISENSNPNGNTGDKKHIKLSDRFLVPPFSVLDARQGYWLERKREWLAMGIQSELGRGGGITWGIAPDGTATR